MHMLTLHHTTQNINISCAAYFQNDKSGHGWEDNIKMDL